jgi:hypothetical protein
MIVLAKSIFLTTDGCCDIFLYYQAVIIYMISGAVIDLGKYDMKKVVKALKGGKYTVNQKGKIVYNIEDLEGKITEVDSADLLKAYARTLSSFRDGIEKVVTGSSALEKALGSVENMENFSPKTKRLSKNVLKKLEECFKQKAVY